MESNITDSNLDINDVLQEAGVSGTDLNIVECMFLTHSEWFGDDGNPTAGFLEALQNLTEEFCDAYYAACELKVRYSDEYREMEEHLGYVQNRFPRQDWSKKYALYFMELFYRLRFETNFLVPKVQELLTDDPNIEYVGLRAMESFEHPDMFIDKEAVAKYIHFNNDRLEQHGINLFFVSQIVAARKIQLDEQYPEFEYQISQKERERLNAKYDDERSQRFREIMEESCEEKTHAAGVANVIPIKDAPMPQEQKAPEHPIETKSPVVHMTQETFLYSFMDDERRNKNLQHAWNRLKTAGMIARSTRFDAFFDIFDGESTEKYICWTGSKADLAYFIKGIVGTHTVTHDTCPQLWNVVRGHFLDIDGNRFGNDLRSQHTPIKTKSMLDFAIDAFTYVT